MICIEVRTHTALHTVEFSRIRKAKFLVYALYALLFFSKDKQ